MSNNYTVLECCLCKNPFGFTFDNNKTNKDVYCYECGHSILLVKNKFSKINWDAIKEPSLEQSKVPRLNQSGTIYYLNKLK